jgi:hypothetical protein
MQPTAQEKQAKKDAVIKNPINFMVAFAMWQLCKIS